MFGWHSALDKKSSINQGLLKIKEISHHEEGNLNRNKLTEAVNASLPKGEEVDSTGEFTEYAIRLERVFKVIDKIASSLLSQSHFAHLDLAKVESELKKVEKTLAKEEKSEHGYPYNSGE